MRIGAITVSVVLHTALIAAAFTLPAPPKRSTPVPVDVDLFQRKPPKVETKPEPPKPEPPKVAEPDKPKPPQAPEPKKPDTQVAMRDPDRPKPTVTPPSTPEPPSNPEPNPGKVPPNKVDLTLHALPGGDGVIVPHDGPGTFGNTYNGNTTPGGKKPWKIDAGNPLTGKLEDVKEEAFPLTPIAGGGYQWKGKQVTARIDHDGRVSFDEKTINDFKGLSGGFDVTDMIMRAKHQDPYRAVKQSFMEHTETLRKKLQADAAKEHMAASLAQLPSHLDSIWRDGARPPEKRRKDIYEVWFSAAEADSDAGREACAVIETYVRRYLPDSGENAFSEEELEKLNRGKKYKFAPYR